MRGRYWNDAINTRVISIIAAVVITLGVALWGFTFFSHASSINEVSQPVQLTSDSYYERGQSIVYDDSEYWMFYGRSASETGSYATGNPDVNDYVLYYKKAGSIAGLASATASQVTVSGLPVSSIYLGETGAVVYDSKVWVFVPQISGSNADLYAYYTSDGGSTWSQAGPYISMSSGQAHHDEVVFGGELWILEGSGDFNTMHSTTPTNVSSFSSWLNVGSLTGGLGHFFVDGSDLYVGLGSAGTYYIYKYNSGTTAWDLVDDKTIAGYYDPSLFKVGSNYVYAAAPYSGGQQWIVGWTGTTLDANFFDGTELDIVEGRYGGNVWVDMWPIGFTDNSGDTYLFYTSERNPSDPSSEIDGNIWYLKYDWDPSRDHYTYIQEAINAASGGDTINIAAETYDEHIDIDTFSGLTLNGADKATVIVKPSSTLCWEVGGYGCSRTAAFRVVSSQNIILQNMTMDFDLIKANGVHGVLYWDSTGTLNNNNLQNMSVSDSSGGYYEITSYIRAPSYTDSARAQVNFTNNTFIDPGRLGIVTHQYVNTAITDNTFYKTTNDFGYAMEIGSESTGTVAGNTIYGFDTEAASDGSESAGIYIENSYTGSTSGLTKPVLVEDNEIYDCQYGMWIGNGYDGYAGDVDIQVTLNDNHLHDNVDGAAWIQDEDKAVGSSVLVSGGGNKLDNNGTHGYYIYTAGDGDVTIDLSEELITGHGKGVYVEDASTGTSTSSYDVTIGNSSFSGNSSFGVDNAVTGLTVDASGSWWGSNTPANVASMVNGSVDYTPWLDVGTNSSTGYGFQGDYSTIWVDDDSPQTGSTGRIQEGVDMVTASTVNVAAGTYREQVEIDKTMSLAGQGSSSIIESPDSLTKKFTTSADNYPIIYIHDATGVTVQDLVVDGRGKGNTNSRFIGIGYRNAGGTVDTVELKDVRDTPFSGAQHGVALYVYNSDTTSRTINVWDSTFTGFQKNAMALNADASTPLVVDVRGNQVTGAGATTVTAQNGVQVWADLGSGDIANNNITGIAYDNTSNPTKWVATSILNYYADLDITGNTISGGHMGIYNIIGTGDLNNNSLSIEKVGVSAYGILATDPPDAVPSPFPGDDSLDPETLELDSAPSPASPTTLAVDISNNTVQFSGTDNTSTYGIEADAGIGADDMTVTAHYNIVEGFDVGMEWYQDTSSTGVFTSITANNNCIEDNTTYGMRSNYSSLTVDATSNWWGDTSGPYHSTNLSGTGNAVSDYINFASWSSTCSTSAGSNFQNTNTLTTYANLQDAVDDAIAGDTIIPIASGPFGAEGSANVTIEGVTIRLEGRTFTGGSPVLIVDADNVTVQGPGVFDGWTGSANNASPAVLVNGGADNFALRDVEVKRWVDGVQLAGSVVSFKMFGNWLHDNTDAGLQIDSAVTSLAGVITIEGNLFKENTGPGIRNDSSEWVIAEYNSWGDIDGPTDTGDAGDGVVGNVYYTPWTFIEVFMDMEPDTEATTVNVDESVPFDVKLKVDAEKLYGLSFKFTYDSTMLALNGSPTFASPWVGKCSLLDLTAGAVSYFCNLTLPDSEYDQDGGTIAAFNFTAAGAGLTGNGPWTTYFDISQFEADTKAAAQGGAKIFVNNAGFGAPSAPERDITDTDDGEVVITGVAQYTGFVDLQGRTDDSGALLNVYDISLKTSATAQADATSSSGGGYTTAYISPHVLTIGTNYYLYFDRDLFLPTTSASASNYLHSHILDTRPHTYLNLLVLLGGDATNDDVIDILDAGCIGGAYGGIPGTCGGSGWSDVNEDTFVDILDLSLMGGNYLLTSSTWLP